MPKKKEYDHKHLSTSQRIHIEKGLNDGLSFAAIARKLDKHPSTIAKEVKKYRTLQPREKDPKKPARCALFKECTLRFLCDKKDCVKMCKSCYDIKLQVSKCSYLCSEYREPQCASISKAPFVCNHCARQRTCNKEKARGLTRLLPISQCLIRLSHHCLPRDSHWRTFMPFTDTRFLVPERRSTIISIRVFLLLKTSIYAARYVTNASQEKLVQGSAWLQKNSV